MNFKLHNSAKVLPKAILLMGLVAFLMLFEAPQAKAQNTKGDRAEVGGNSGPRKSRFKGKSAKKKGNKKPFNRIVPGKSSLANTTRSFKRKPSGNQKTVSSRSQFVHNSERKPHDAPRPSRTRVSVRSRSNNRDNVFPQYGAYVNNPSKKPGKVSKPVSNRGTLARLNRLQGSPKGSPPGRKRKIVPRTASSSFIRHRTINSNAGFWNVKRKGEVSTSRDLAGRPIRGRNYQTPNRGVIESSSPYAGRKRIGGDHPYKGSYGGGTRFGSRPSTSQRAWRGDIAGRKIRGRNFTSKPEIEGQPITGPRRSKPQVRDHAYRGSMPYGYKSASRGPEKRTGTSPLPARVPGIGASGIGGYRGNVKALRPLKGGGSRSGKLWNNQGSAIQGKTPGIGGIGVGTFQGNLKGRKPLKGGGSRSGHLWNNRGTAIQGKTPGIGGVGVGTFQGNIKGQKPLKGGGSRSGRLWNNRGAAIQGRTPGIGANGVGTYQGNLKGYKPLKGGGSVSGRMWNNRGTAVQGRVPGIGANGVGTYQGNLKGHRPLKGGGSVSGRLWNNRGSAIQGRVPGIGANGVGTYQGNLKGHRPLKGGGSVSGRTWNNSGSAIQGRVPGIGANGVGTYQGNLKGHRPLKGGGSVSGRLWNNKQSAIPARPPSASQMKAGGYTGSLKQYEQTPGFNNQGEEFTGYQKLKRKAYIQNPNSAKESTLKKKPTSSTYAVDGLQVKVKRRDYIVNKNSSEDALKKLSPTETTIRVGNLQVAVQRRKYIVNKNSAEMALKKLAPTEATKNVANLQVKVKQYHYIHNPSSAKEALNVREPGKAFAKATDYQGNIRMKKFDLAKLFSEKNRQLHPDAKFVKINKNNVDDERDMLTNIKLWWAKKFRKNDTQPKNLKEREKKPRYDKGEQGLWAE